MNDLLEPDEKVLVCSVIVTAEYIIETTQQLDQISEIRGFQQKT